MSAVHPMGRRARHHVGPRSTVDRGSRDSRIAETRRDAVLYLHWLFRHAPRWVSRMHIRLLVGLARLASWFPRNPIRQACEDVAALARAAGHDHRPRDVYRRLLAQFQAAAGAFLDVLRQGPDVVIERADLPVETTRTIRRLLARHTSLILAVPHNVGGILYSMRLAHDFPALVLLKNSNAERRDRAVRRFFGELGVDVYLTRSTGPFGLFRACLQAAHDGKVLVATVDNIYPGRKNQTLATIFGRQVKMTPWAPRIALRSAIPLLPAWVTLDDGRFKLIVGEPYFGDSVDGCVQHYVDYFEERILEDPASWLFLGHRRWHQVLHEAASENGGRRSPSL